MNIELSEKEKARFGGVARLYGAKAMAALKKSRVCVVGTGGVGSWTVEALARSGVGAITLIDPDEVCRTNVNRQLPALESTLGKAKIEVLAERVRDIYPECEVETVQEFLVSSNAGRLLSKRFDFVVDAVDRMSIKALILHGCKDAGIPALTVGGAGGRRDPSRVEIRDFGRVGGDELLRLVRRKLRREYGWAGGADCVYGIPAVFSSEPMVYPGEEGCIAERPREGEGVRIDCAAGIGSASFVTGTFGFFAAAEVVRRIVEKEGA